MPWQGGVWYCSPITLFIAHQCIERQGAKRDLGEEGTIATVTQYSSRGIKKRERQRGRRGEGREKWIWVRAAGYQLSDRIPLLWPTLRAMLEPCD